MEYPSEYVAADNASKKAQKKFLGINVAQLATLVLTAFVSGLNPTDLDHQRQVAWTVAILMLLTLILTAWQRWAKYDDHWFKCRAYAENIKSAAWEYMMSGDSSAAKTRFLMQAKEIQSRLADVQRDLIAEQPQTSEKMTAAMKELQSKSIAEKVAEYRQQRITNQCDWYRKNSGANTTREQWWTFGVIVVEIIAVGYAVIQALVLWKLNAVGGIATLSATFIAWIQIKRFSDLSTSYAVAAVDIENIHAEKDNIVTQPELDDLVVNIERAVSREHSLWVSNRVPPAEKR